MFLEHVMEREGVTSTVLFPSTPEITRILILIPPSGTSKGLFKVGEKKKSRKVYPTLTILELCVKTMPVEVHEIQV